MKKNAIIIDDERLARNELKKMLALHPEIEVVGEAANADEGLNLINELTPDLILLDIQMPVGVVIRSPWTVTVLNDESKSKENYYLYTS